MIKILEPGLKSTEHIYVGAFMDGSSQIPYQMSQATHCILFREYLPAACIPNIYCPIKFLLLHPPPQNDVTLRGQSTLDLRWLQSQLNSIHPLSTCTTLTSLDNADASMLFKQGCPQPLIDSIIRHYSLWSAFFPVCSKVELWIAAL